MSKRIFTKVFTGFTMATTAVEVVENAVQNWLLQESIEVIGAQAVAQNITPSENDGFAQVRVELSQVGVHGLDGAILAVSASEGWNTVPAGITRDDGQVAVAFPDGMAVPVREEGYLYINVVSTGKTAGTSIFEWEVIVFYIKKGTR